MQGKTSSGDNMGKTTSDESGKTNIYVIDINNKITLITSDDTG